MKEKQSELDNKAGIESDRKSFDEILSSYEVKSKSRSLNPDHISNTIEKVVNCFKSRILKQIQKYSYCRFIYNHSFSIALLPITIIKILQRALLLQESYAFKIIQQSGIKRKILIIMSIFSELQHKSTFKYFKCWKSFKNYQKNKCEEKLKIISCKNLVKQFTKKIKIKKKILFKISKALFANFQREKTLKAIQKSKIMPRIILLCNKIQYKLKYFILSRRFKKFRQELNSSLKKLNSSDIMYIDPKYKIEIVPPLDESGSPELNQSFSIEYGNASNRSLKNTIDSNSFQLGASSASMSPNSDSSPFVDKVKEIENFKGKVFNKNKIKHNTEPKSPPLLGNFSNKNILKRNSFNLGSPKKPPIPEKSALQKQSIIKDPSTPNISTKAKQANTLKKSLAFALFDQINIAIPNNHKSQEILCKAIIKILFAKLSEIFKLLTDNKSCSPSSKNSNNEYISNNINGNLIDSWKLNLYSLGITKFTRNLNAVLKRNIISSYQQLKLSSN